SSDVCSSDLSRCQVKNAVTGYSQSMLRRRNRIWFDSSLPCLRRSSSVALGGRYPGFHSGSGTSVISAMYFPLGGHLPCEDSDLKSDSVMWNVMLMVCTPCGALACGTRWLRVRREKLFFAGSTSSLFVVTVVRYVGMRPCCYHW